MKKLFLLCAIGATLVTGKVLAGDNDEIGYLVRKYMWHNVIPVVMDKRKEFDVNLNASEHTLLNQCRAEIADIRAGILLKKLSECNGNVRLQKVMQLLDSIAEDHKTELDEIFADIATQHRQWTADVKDLQMTHMGYEVRASEGNSDITPLIIGTFGDSWINMEGQYARSIFLWFNAGSPVAVTTVSLTIYPNPTATSFSMNMMGATLINKLVIVDITGNLVSERENISSNESISCNNMSNGIYLLQFFAAGQVLDKKLIVCR